jgi:hypothetical protein
MQDLLENQLSADLRKEARPTIPDFAAQRRELFDAVQNAFIDILAGKSLQERLTRTCSRTSFALRAVSVVSVLSAIVAGLMKSRNPTVGIGAAAVAGIGLLLVVFLAFNHRRQVLRGYERELDPKQPQFKQTLESQFGKAVHSFCAEMSKRFQTLANICQTQRARYEPLSQCVEELQKKFAELKPRLS